LSRILTFSTASVIEADKPITPAISTHQALDAGTRPPRAEAGVRPPDRTAR